MPCKPPRSNKQVRASSLVILFGLMGLLALPAGAGLPGPAARAADSEVNAAGGAAADCTPPVFSLPQTYEVGAGPTSAASGDFNGDGVKDLAVPNNISSNVSVLLGDGVGGFGPPVNFAVAQLPSSVAVADFNKDGKADLAVGHSWGGGPLSVLFGDGTGKFSAPSVVNTGAPTNVFVGDFNGDTNPDIVAGVAQGSPRVLLGDGAGGFTLKQFSVGDDSRFVAVGEFNGDGIADLAFGVDDIPDELVIVFGNASGNFAVHGRLQLDQSPKAMVARDFNGDGRDDLAVTVQHFEPRLHIFINDGAGNFVARPFTVVAQEPVGLAAADFNNDGKADLAVGNGSAQILLGEGTGFFSVFSMPAERYLTGGGVMLAGDFNNDGKADLVSPRANVGVLPGVVSVILGRGDGTFEVSRSRRFNVGPSSLAVTDFNGDGRSDLTSTFNFSPSVGFVLGDGAGGLTNPSFIDVPGAAGWVTTGDFDGDGRADAASANIGTGSGTVTVFYGNGAGFVSRFTHVSAQAMFVAAGNFNGDGRSDLVALTDTGRVTVLLSTGPSTFSAAPGSPFELAPGLPFGSTSAVAVGDFNGDGRDDLATATTAQNSVSIYLNDGAGRLTLSSTAAIPIGTSFREKHLAVGDFNRDGRLDVVSANGESRNVTVFLGDGAGGLGSGTNFASTARNFDSARALFMAVADFNGDANPDLAVSNSNSSFGGDLSVLFGDGAGGFGLPFTQPVGASPWVLAAGNFNADSKPDLAIIGLASNSITVLQNVYEPLPCLSVGDAAVVEGDSGTQGATFNVTLSQASTQTVRVNYSVKGVTATEGADYVAASGRLVFAPGETSKTVPVPVAGDALDEPDETFELKLASPSHAALADATGTGTITDNDPTPTLSVADVAVTEGNFFGDGGGGSANFKIQLSAPSGRNVTVRYATAPGTATPGILFGQGDYANTSFTATIPAGQTFVNVSVGINRDNIFELDETFFLDLSDPVNADIADGRGQATIVNDDPVPTVAVQPGAFLNEGDSGQTAMTFTLQLSNPSSQAVSVDYSTADGTAVAPADYAASAGTVTFAPEETTKTFNVMVNGDTADEVDETFVVTFGNPVNGTLSADMQATGFILDDDGPSISVNDVSVAEGNTGTTDATFTVSLSAPSPQTVEVSFFTTNGTALLGADYQPRSNAFIRFQPGSTSGTVVVRVNGDTAAEPDETFFLNLFAPKNGTIGDAQGVGTILDDDAAQFQLASQTLSVGEGEGKATITVTRSGQTSASAAVDYAVAEGTASERSDYTTALGTMRFAAGETHKSIDILLTDDALAEGAETLTFTLSNPAGGSLGSPSSTVVTVVDNDAADGPSPVRGDAFDASFFVRQHYLDFFSREADAPGLAHWTGVVNGCAPTTPCGEVLRVNVSGAFFLSIEFEQTGYLVERAYKAAYGDAVGASTLNGPHQLTVPVVRFEEFLPDTQRIGRDVVVLAPGWEELLEANKQAYFLEFVQRGRFTTAFPSAMTPTEFVDQLNTRAGGALDAAERQNLIGELTNNNTTSGRASVLRKVAEDSTLFAAERNRAFVLMQYFGYLRRDPNEGQDTDYTGYDFWLGNLNHFNGNFVQAELVKAFISSEEYRKRFGL
ncbi:MAG TPA: Calx-beta domain-containing protein [Pyrinomonadaceae bacterium]|jgi:hypothetical protein|nr:Calx-beta domain-containing protein [Pyrinomonadaceae bacterium]